MQIHVCVCVCVCVCVRQVQVSLEDSYFKAQPMQRPMYAPPSQQRRDGRGPDVREPGSQHAHMTRKSREGHASSEGHYDYNGQGQLCLSISIYPLICVRL